ncbi:MAG: hypothetical protein JEZ05_05460 [Tenericutes bacterium]|nr:hypothetical protein [Mycoplasmatota bacterium]
MSVNTMRRKVTYSLVLLIFSLALFVFSSYAYFTNMYEDAFMGEMGIVDVSLEAYFETVTQSSNLASASDVTFDTHTITSVVIDLSVYTDGSTIRIDNSNSNEGYLTVSGTPTANSLVVLEDLTYEAPGQTITIDQVVLENIPANEVVISSSNKYTATDLGFVASTHTITSSTTNLSVYADGDTIRIFNSNSNDRHYTVSGTPTSTALVVVEDLTNETAGTSISIDKVVTKPGVYHINIVSSGNESYFEDFRLIVYVYSSLGTYLRVKMHEQLTLTYTDYQGDITELSILFDGYMPFKYNTTNWYDNRINDNYLYYKSPVERIDEFTPTELPLISEYFSTQDYATSPPGYSLQIAFSIEAVQFIGGPEEVWDLTTKPWDGLTW